MKKIQTILVVALKYNDILYALSTEEFEAAKEKKLLIIYANGKMPEKFPCQEFFTSVCYFPYIDNFKKMYVNLYRAYKCRAYFESDCVSFSNPVLLITKLIFKYSKAARAIWLEDGLMNYYSLQDIKARNNQYLKQIFQCVFRLPEIESIAKTSCTYLLQPDFAQSFMGEKHRIVLKPFVIERLSLDSLNFIDGKKIFVGQPLYDTEKISIEEYNAKVNNIISRENIDYYVPHFLASSKEKINAPHIRLEAYNVTLEFIASKYTFEVYSISSTVLYSAKLLNPKIKSHVVNINGLASSRLIIKKIADEIINC